MGRTDTRRVQGSWEAESMVELRRGPPLSLKRCLRRERKVRHGSGEERGVRIETSRFNERRRKRCQ
jgi:hypothetical protein